MEKTSGKIRINHESIKNALKGFSGHPEKAIIEYIWNGFDADAENIDINYNFQRTVDGVPFGEVSLEILDDGKGWDYAKTEKIEIFLSSDKKTESCKSLPHGKNGVGRCTFFVFSKKVVWETVYKGSKSVFAIDASNLDDYLTLDHQVSITKGTKARFEGIFDALHEGFFNDTLPDAIKHEFGWFLLLYPQKQIRINGKALETESLVRAEEKIPLEIMGRIFDVHIVQWNQRPTTESSKYYFLNEKGIEIAKKTTGLNYKSDVFHHSVYVKSSLYSAFNPCAVQPKKQERLIDDGSDEAHARLLNEIREKLILFRRTYLYRFSNQKIGEWKELGIFPKVEDITIPAKEYEEVVRDIYVAAPQLFSNTSPDQKRITLRMLAALLGTEGREDILKILDQVFRLSSDDKKALAELLGRTSLSSIIRTVKDVELRVDTIATLEHLLFNPAMRKETLEVKHLQKVLDENAWVFGEEYRLFASTEGSIKSTLIRYAKDILEISPNDITTASKKELDLLLIKQDRMTGVLRNLVIEIKRPSVIIGKKELDQILEYKDAILKEPACNGDDIEWEFLLMGNDYNEAISDAITNVSGLGEKRRGLVLSLPDKRVKVYVRKWSDLINVDLKNRYAKLIESLQLKERDLSGMTHEDVVSGTKEK